MFIVNSQLGTTKYPIDELINNINHLNLKTILRTQELTYDFVVNYILNPKYQFTPEEKSIDYYIVLFNQPHLDPKKLKNLIDSQQK